MVLEVFLVTAPVIGMEVVVACITPSAMLTHTSLTSGLLLGIVQDGVSGGSCGGVVQDVREQGRVHLKRAYNTRVKHIALTWAWS